MNEDNSLTKKDMRESLKLYNLVCCQATISNNLKKIGFTRKWLRKIPAERNSERIIGLMQYYARELRKYLPSQLVYLG